MPTPQDLQRLRGLLTQLNAISNVQRGELIRAEDWNTLVAAVTDVAQAVLAEDTVTTVPPHDHPDQVTSAWLSPQFRDVFERGPLADPRAQQRIVDLEENLKRLSDRLDKWREDVDQFRTRLTDVATRDLEREAAVTNVRRAVESALDPRADLLNLRNTLATVQREMGRVMQAASRMTVNGQVVDLGTVVNRVTDLEGFRNRLRSANGELLDAATIERRLGEISNRSVTQQQMDEAFRRRPTQVAPEVVSGIEERVGTNLRTQVNERLGTFNTEIRTEINTRMGGIGALVTSRLNDALPGVTQTVNTTLTATIEAARRAAVETAIAGATQSIKLREQSIRADMDRLITTLEGGIPGTVRTEIGQQLPEQLAGMRGDVTAITRKVDTVSALATRQSEVLNQHAVAIAAIPKDNATLKNELRQSLIAEIETRSANTSRSLDERFTNFDRTTTDRLKILNDEMRKISSDTAQKVATETSAAQMRALRAQMLAEIRTIAREEVTTGVRDQVKSSVNEAVKEQFASVPGLIATEVRRTNVAQPRDPRVTGGGGRLGGGQ